MAYPRFVRLFTIFLLIIWAGIIYSNDTESFYEGRYRPVEKFESNVNLVPKYDNYNVQSNNYFSDNISPHDIMSQETDLSPFFELDQDDYYNTLNRIKYNMSYNNNVSGPLPMTNEPLDPQFYKGAINNTGIKSDMWEYNNENEMNGGMLGGTVSPLDPMNDHYSVYEL